jgi:PEGA domain
MPEGLARRIIAVSSDALFGQRLRRALEPAAGGPAAVEVYPTAAAAAATVVQAALCVVHLDGDLTRPAAELLPRLTGTCPVLAVLPGPNVAAAVAVALMQAGTRVAGVMAAGADLRRLSAVAARVLDASGGPGVSGLVAPGTPIHALDIAEHRAKSACLAQILRLVEQVDAPARLRASIEQCVDEMLMNALYDAPIDARGAPLFARISAKDRTELRSEQLVTVRYACDGRQLVVSVRDAFGSLKRDTVLRHLHKGLHAAEQIERKVGGAGLGLYLMAHSSTMVHFHVVPGVATEALCAFDLQAPRIALEHLGCAVQLDTGGQPVTAPSRRIRVVPRRRRPALWAAVAAVGALAAALVLWRATGGGGGGAGGGGGGAGGGAREGSPPATVELDSQPAGAAVSADGVFVGSTPLALTTLAPGATVSIAFELPGYRTATARLEVPASGGRTRHAQPLQLSDEFVRVRFVSQPPGAQVARTGQPPAIDRTYAPTELFLQAGVAQRFTLTMPRHVPLVIEPFTPARGSPPLEKGGALAPGATLRLEAPRGGKATVAGAPHCTELALPASCTLAPGTYEVEYIAPDQSRSQRSVTMATEDVVVDWR